MYMKILLNISAVAKSDKEFSPASIEVGGNLTINFNGSGNGPQMIYC